MHAWLHLSNDILFVYYLSSNLIYLVLLITAISRNTWHRHRIASLRLDLFDLAAVSIAVEADSDDGDAGSSQRIEEGRLVARVDGFGKARLLVRFRLAGIGVEGRGSIRMGLGHDVSPEMRKPGARAGLKGWKGRGTAAAAPPV